MPTRKTRRSPPRENPRIGKHPDLFLPKTFIGGGGPSDRGEAQESDVFVDVSDMSPVELLRAARDGLLTQDDLDDVADDLDPDVYDEVEEALEEGREARIAPVLEAILAEKEAVVSNCEPGGSEHEAAWDEFQRNVVGGSTARYAAKKLLDGTEYEDISPSALSEALNDPEVYDFELDKSGYPGRGGDELWTWRVGEQQVDLWWHKGWTSPPLEAEEGREFRRNSDDLKEVLRRLEREGVYLRFRKKSDDLVKAFESGFIIRVTDPDDWHYVARLSEKNLLAKLSGVADAVEVEDVVYRYAGTNDTIAGASARGHYVVALKPSQLKAEGAALGICVGRDDMGYKRRLKEGQIALYSIRTEAGKSKFCIEIGISFTTDSDAVGQHVLQVKGKGNRIPGFTLENAHTLSKPDEVRLVTEFLLEGLELSSTPEGQRQKIERADDMKPGILALKAEGIDPFSPPVVRRRLKENPALPVPPRVARLAEQAMSRPWGGVWGTGEDDVQENPAESLVIEEGLSPLEYDRADDVRRYALVDLSAGPPKRGDAYFAELRSVTRIGKTGKPLKKPRETVTPGAAPGVVAFIDWSPLYDGSVYIHYMKTRQDARGKRHIQRLLDHLYTQHRAAPMIDWGRVMNAHAWDLLKRYRDLEAEGYPHTTGKNMSM